jgi:hypothetical protein
MAQPRGRRSLHKAIPRRNPIPPHDPERPLVLGGSITRGPDGQLQTLQTHGIHPSPKGVQEVWSNAHRRLYPEDWHGEELPDVGFRIEWQPREIACGSCGTKLGGYVAYRAGDECGIVEDTVRVYERTGGRPKEPRYRQPRPRPRFRLESKDLRYAAATTACFHCPGCKKTYRRNLLKLGRAIFEDRKTGPFLID